MNSNCCNAPLRVAGGDEGTNWHECTACGKPCDAVEQSAPVAGHTAGPWRVVPIGSELYVKADGPYLICDMQRNECENEARARQCEANARLIASAPTLLRERDRLMAQLESVVKACNHSTLVAGMHRRSEAEAVYRACVAALASVQPEDRA